jgi:hypothetical protein
LKKEGPANKHTATRRRREARSDEAHKEIVSVPRQFLLLKHEMMDP